MAANLNSQGLASFGKQFVSQIRSSSLSSSLSLINRRGVHASVYDKNLDDNVRPVIVPNDLIQPQSEKYWAPHPQTGVFGPPTEHNLAAGGERAFYTLHASTSEGSVLEQKAFFRPLEDLEKPPHY